MYIARKFTYCPIGQEDTPLHLILMYPVPAIELTTDWELRLLETANEYAEATIPGTIIYKGQEDLTVTDYWVLVGDMPPGHTLPRGVDPRLN